MTNSGPRSEKPARKLVRALTGERQATPPIWMMRQAGRYLPEYLETRARSSDFLNFCYTPELACEATLQPITRFGLDAAIIFSDILVIPDALGQQVSFKPGVGPVLDALQGRADIDRLDPEKVTAHLAPVYEAISKAREILDPSVSLIGFAGAPWTLAAYMIEGGGSKDFMQLKSWAFGDDDSFQVLIDILADSVIDHLSAQIEAGCDVVQIFDSWAGVLDAYHVGIWSIAPLSRITRRIRQLYPHVPVIIFPNRAGFALESYARACGAQGMSIDSSVPLDFAARTLQPLVTVQGNLDPAYLLSGGRSLREAVQRILVGLKGGPFVFNLGHGVTPKTPPENVAEVVRLVRGGGA